MRRDAQVLSIRNFAQLRQANIRFGDLTILIGPQATGKSLVLQLLKLAVDVPHVRGALRHHGYDWKGDWRELAKLHFGEGFEDAWGTNTSVSWNGGSLTREALAKGPGRDEERLYFIPAHRMATLADGFPQRFQQPTESPFVARAFSESVRQFLDRGARERTLFPVEGRMKAVLRDKLTRSLFRGASLGVETTGSRRRLVLDVATGRNRAHLPYMAWTAGQREFVPLLIGLLYLMPPTKTPRKGDIDWVVIEELEMGLHPKAIEAVMLVVFDLLSRGYRVALSTHSPTILDVAWGLMRLKEHGGNSRDLCDIFDIEKSKRGSVAKMMNDALRKDVRVHFLHDQGKHVNSQDISALDPGSRDDAEAGWGGLTGFADRSGWVIRRVMNRHASSRAKRRVRRTRGSA
jgi:hypothetical protein